MNDDDDDLHDDDDAADEIFPIYIVDDETRSIIEAALNCLVTLADTQILEEGSDAILAIADAMADRFGIQTVELEDVSHTTDDGDEIIYKPKSGLFNDDNDDTEQPS